MMLRNWLLPVAVALPLFFGCGSTPEDSDYPEEEESVGDEMGEELEDAGDDTADGIEEAGDDVEDAMD